MPRALTVDDDPITLRTIAAVLKKEGFDVVMAHDGTEALEKIKLGKFDLVVSDVMMPEMNGWALVRKLRMQPEYAMIPVIFLTSMSSTENRLQGFGLGADDFLAKPFEPADLAVRAQEAVRRAASMHESARKAMLSPVQMEGSLEQFGLPTLLMLMNMEKKTGRLLVVNDHDNLQVLVRNGLPIYAALGGTMMLSGKEALYEALTWDLGRFTFTVCAIEQDDEIFTPLNELLVEAAKRVDQVA
jgi:DNA-binding response OmpR family regulator